MKRSIINQCKLLAHWFNRSRTHNCCTEQYNSNECAYSVREDGDGLIRSLNGEFWPWYTFPAIEYLSQIDFGKDAVFEYGCGSSTIFWAQRAKKVVSVEHDADWASKIRKIAPNNVEIVAPLHGLDYPYALSKSEDRFDVIVIDGLKRVECCRNLGKALKTGGLVILDNSDWYSTAASILRDLDLLQVDMSGWGPLNNYTWTTSIFFHRSFKKTSLDGRQPHYSRRALQHPDTLE